MPPIPVAQKFEIPEIFENFIRYDSGSNDHERIILWGDPKKLRVLEKSPSWLADGTFQITPKMFYQLHSIHVSVSGIAPACFYAFLRLLKQQYEWDCSNNKCSRGMAFQDSILFQRRHSKHVKRDASVQKLIF